MTYTVQGGMKLFYTRTRKEEKFFISLCEEYHEKILKYLYYAVGNIEDVTFYELIDSIDVSEYK